MHHTCLFYKTTGSDDKSSIVPKVPNLLSAPTFSFETELWSQEWHDSFVRNELVDFCPPLSSQLNCLLLGGGDGNVPQDSNGAPLMLNGNHNQENENQNEGEKQHMIDNGKHSIHEDEANKQDSALLARLFMSNSQQALSSYRHDEQTADLDCIFDPGLLDTLLFENKNEHDVGLLLLEATSHIREFGVYICVTKQPLSTETQQYLQNMGALLGMQWRFHLDEISNETHGSVSVARKYFVGDLPTVGKLATVKRHMP